MKYKLFLTLILVVAAPTLAQQTTGIDAACDLDMAIIMDSSGSIGSDMDDLKNAVRPFAQAFVTQTDTEILVTDFDRDADVLQPYTDNVSLLNDAIAQPEADGTTNWEDALRSTHTYYNNRAATPDLYLFASDGKPRAYLDDDGNVVVPGGGDPYSVPLQEATEAADAIKADGVTIYGIGIGDLNRERMEAIATEGRVITSDFDELAENLADVAREICQASITVTKTINDDPAQGWNITVDGDDTVTQTTSSDGTTTFDLYLEETKTIRVTETVQAGYVLDDAVCTVGGDERGTQTERGVANITVQQGDSVACTLTNTEETYCGDGTIQQPNDNGTIEECDGPIDDPNQRCTEACTVKPLTYLNVTVRNETTTVPGVTTRVTSADTRINQTNTTDTNGLARYDLGVNETTTVAITPDLGANTTITTGSCRVNGDTQAMTIDPTGIDDLTISPATTTACTIAYRDLTYCGDGTIQQPNDNGTIEECDGPVGEDEVCKACTLYREVPVTVIVDNGTEPQDNVTTIVENGETVTDVTDENGTSSVDLTVNGTENITVTVDVPDNTTVDDVVCTDNGVTENSIIYNNTITNITIDEESDLVCDTTIRSLTYCGDGSVQQPNDNGIDEACDGTAGTGPNEICTAQCEVVTNVTCASPSPILLHEGISESRPYSTIVASHGADLTTYSVTANVSDVTVTTGASSFTASSDGLEGETTGRLTFTEPSTGLNTTCTVSFLRLPFACDSATCRACDDEACLRSNDCLATDVSVPDPSRSLLPSAIVSLPDQYSYDVSLTSFSPNFTITPTSGTGSTPFTFMSDAPDGFTSAGRMEIGVEDYGTVEACFGLRRVNLELGQGEPPSSDLPPPDDIPVNLPSGGVEPRTDLLVIGSRAVAPYYREAGTVEPIGPYVFTAKVWVR